jgi:hypothetical protein
MTDRESFLQRASQQSLSAPHEKEAADGLDYLGNQEEIEAALNGLEKRLGIDEKQENQSLWWKAAASILLIGGVFWVWNVKQTPKGEKLAEHIPPSSVEKSKSLENNSDFIPPNPKKEAQNTELKPQKEEQIQGNNQAMNSESKESDVPALEFAKDKREAALPISEPIPAGSYGQVVADDAVYFSSAKNLTSPKIKIGKGTWEEKLLQTGIWDGQERLFPTRIPAVILNGKLKLIRTGRFSENKWNALDSLIQNGYENELRQGTLELILPLR